MKKRHGLSEIRNEGSPASTPQKQKTSKVERRVIQSISKNSCILGELAKKGKGRQKTHPTETLSVSSSILVFYPGGAAGHLCLALSTSHSFWIFWRNGWISSIFR